MAGCHFWHGGIFTRFGRIILNFIPSLTFRGFVAWIAGYFPNEWETFTRIVELKPFYLNKNITTGRRISNKTYRLTPASSTLYLIIISTKRQLSSITEYNLNNTKIAHIKEINKDKRFIGTYFTKLCTEKKVERCT